MVMFYIIIGIWRKQFTEEETWLSSKWSISNTKTDSTANILSVWSKHLTF